MADKKATAYIVIGSKLAIGLVLNHPLDPTIKVTIQGLNSAPKGTNGRPIIVPYATTNVDVEFWEAWKMGNHSEKKPFPPLKSGAIWEAKSENDAKAISRENENRRTGVEPMRLIDDERMGKDKGKLKPATAKDPEDEG